MWSIGSANTASPPPTNSSTASSPWPSSPLACSPKNRFLRLPDLRRSTDRPRESSAACPHLESRRSAEPGRRAIPPFVAGEMKTTAPNRLEVTVRPLLESDLPAAERIVRLAFGTFLGMPDPTAFMGDAVFARTRWLADPQAVL